jgi:hypothetical protein
MAEWWRRLLGRAIQAAPEPVEERRICVRYPCAVETMLQPANGPTPVRLSARVRNISKSGINFLSEHQFEAGELLSVELPGPAEKPTTEVLAYIIRAIARSDGEWEYGCTFALELYDDDLTPFGALRQKAEPVDLRTWVRFPCNINATYQPMRPKEAVPLAAKVVDISASGIGLEVAEAISVGALLNMHISTLSGGTAMPMLVSVVRVTLLEAKQWLLGCNFLRELTDKELGPFLKKGESTHRPT